MEEIPVLFEACTPRSDVLDGTLEEEQFAASLASVVFEDETAQVYKDAASFYETTYPTDGLKSLLTNLMARFSSGEGSDQYTNSILALDTTFGGGKTHDLIAAYHLAEHPRAIGDLNRFSESDEITERFSQAVEDGIDVNTAVFVGGYVDAQNTRCDDTDPDAPNTQTMWGEIAYQLFGTEGYEEIKDYDKEQNAPGEKTLKRLFDQHDGPSLVLIDEIAEYIEDASAVEVGNATLASQTLSFLDSLIETAARLDDLIVVYSIAETAFEAEAEEVRKQISELDSIAKRQHHTITPTGQTEIGAVLQHRLFEEIDGNASEQVAEKYLQFYQDGSRTLPGELTEPDYKDRLEREYPFHPTVISTLTEKIDSIPDFQRTRGALQLLARAIHYLWNNQPANYNRHFIRVYDMTPADDAPAGSIKAKMNETLFDERNLSPAVKADIYDADDTAHAQKEDKKWTEKGLPSLGSHVATTVLWNSLAIGDRAIGVTREGLYAAIGHPAVDFDNYDAVVEALTGQTQDMDVACYFLYQEDMLKFKSVPNLIRLIDKHKSNVTPKRAEQRFEERLEKEVGSGDFDSTLFPEEKADMPDQYETARVGIMHYDSVSIDPDNGSGSVSVPEPVEDLYQKTAAKHGGRVETRQYKNYVMFLTPDKSMLQDAKEEAKKLEGMEDLREKSQGTDSDLTDEQFEDLQERIDTARGLLGEQIRQVYRYLFYPTKEGLKRASIASVDSGGSTDLLDAIRVTLDDLDRIIRDDSAAKGGTWFRSRLWQETKTSMSTLQLQKQFAKKPGLPYLLTTKPLRKTMARMVKEEEYAYWDGEYEKAYWAGDGELENWTLEEPITDSPDVSAAINSTDIKISDDHRLYESMDALLEQQDIEEPEPDVITCAGCGEELPDAEGPGKHYCEDCKEEGNAHCQECGTELEEYGPKDEPITCDDCKDKGPSTWTETTEMASASRALKQIQKAARSSADEEGAAGLSRLVIDMGGEQVLKHGFFLAKQAALKNRSDNIQVTMDYQSKASVDTVKTTFSTEFKGPLTAFRDLNSQFESFTDQYDGQRSIDLTFVYDVGDDPEELDEETDILTELLDTLEGTAVKMQLKAEGISAVGDDDG